MNITLSQRSRADLNTPVNKLDPIILERIHNAVIQSREFTNLGNKTQIVDFPLDDETRTRLTHTLEVSYIATSIAKECSKNDNLFVLTVNISALAHDLGHTPAGHEGEKVINSFLQSFDETPRYLQNRNQDLGEKYLNDVKVKKHSKTENSDLLINSKMVFEHNEHSIRVLNEILKRHDLPLYNCIRDAILYHSTSRTPLPNNLLSQIVRISDKIAYYIDDFQDLKREGYLNEGEEIFSDEESVIYKLQSQKEMVSEYLRTGQITGGINEYKQYKKLINSKNPEDIAKAKNLKEYLLQYFPYFFQLCEGSDLITNKIEQTNSDLKSDSITKKISAILNFLNDNPKLKEEKLREFNKYTSSEQVAYYVASLTNQEILALYKDIENNLSQKLGSQSKYIVKDFFSINNELLQLDFNKVSTTHENLEDFYYDTCDHKLADKGYILRIRKNFNGTYTGTLKKNIEVKGKEVISEYSDVFLTSHNLTEFIERLITEKGINKDLFVGIEKNPLFQINTNRKIIKLNYDDQENTLNCDRCTIIDLEDDEMLTHFNKIEAVNWGIDNIRRLRKACKNVKDIELLKQSNGFIGTRLKKERKLTIKEESYRD